MGRPSLATLALAVAAAAPLTAAAQFFYTANITSIDPAACSTTGAFAVVGGTFSYFLPDAPENVIFSIAVNGGPPSVDFFTLSPPSQGPQTITGITITFPASTPLPWSAVLEQFPAINGQRVGSGVRATVFCPAGGPGTITFANVFASAAAVPALPEHGAAMLSALVALAFALHLRRSRRPPTRRRD